MSKLDQSYFWPEVFTDENFEYAQPPNTHREPERWLRLRGQAIADGLCGWATCMAGESLPAFFGSGMVKVGSIAGAVLVEELSAAQKKWLEEWSAQFGEQDHATTEL